MAVVSKARQLHAKALKLREEKKFLEALQVGEEGLQEYQKDNDVAGFGELLGMQAKTYLHVYDFTAFKPYLTMAMHLSLASVEIVEELGDLSATILPLYDLGKIYEDAGNLPDAAATYQKAVERMQSNPPANHNRKSVLANMKVHLHTTEYKNGDKSALERAEAALKNLESSNDASDYEKHVWVSGAQMRIADMLREDDVEKAREYLVAAEEIINADPELVIRKEQLEKLRKTFE